MEILQQLKKKYSSSEKKFKECLLSKARPIHYTSSPHQSSTILPDAYDAGIVVSHPPPEVRLVLFKELGDCDRPILFDSKSFQKNSPNEAERYSYVRSPPDWNALAEMLFGSVGMAQKAASLKIHYFKHPQSIMLSRVFCLSPKASVTASFPCENYFEAQRANSILSRRKANTMPVPLPPPSTPSNSVASSYSSSVFHRSDSGISLSSTASSSFQPVLSSPIHIGSLGTVGNQIPSAIPHSRANSLPKNKRDSFTVTDEIQIQTPSERLLRRSRIKIGFAVICSPEPSDFKNFQRFFFEHFPIIESHMTALKENIERAFQLKPKGNFIDLMMKALDDFSTRLHMLYSSPRLPEPVWSTLNCPSLTVNHRQVVVNSFVGDLSRLVSDFNTKQKNFFVSGLLTAVLTYHLGWVTSVTPTNELACENGENEYNALWAQLGDLYGAIGSPTKVCRTLVTGGCHELVSTFLSVLSYFIRSSRVDDVISVPCKIDPMMLGVQQPTPFQSVSVHLVPSEIEDSEYVLVSFDDSSVDKDEAKTSHSESLNKTSVSRCHSSPYRSGSDEEDTASLTRSNTGPTKRPRSNAILDSKHAIRRCGTFSNNITKPKNVQSRRRSRDTPEYSNSVSSSQYSRTPVASSIRSSTSFNSFRSSSNNFDPTLGDLERPKSLLISSSYQTDDKDSDGPCRKMSSFSDLIQPPVERVENVQRACTEAPAVPTVESFSFEKDDYWPAGKNSSEVEFSFGANGIKRKASASHQVTQKKSTDCEKSRATRNGKVKFSSRRKALPLETNDKQTKEPSRFDRIDLSRIPSVEMNHNAFEEYFDIDASDVSPDFTEARQCDSSHADHSNRPSDTVSDFSSSAEHKLTVTESKTHHVTSCPNFSNTYRSLHLQLKSETSPGCSLYPNLNTTEEPQRLDCASDCKLVKNVYPQLPSESNFDNNISFGAINEQASCDKTEKPSQVLQPSPASIRQSPSPSRMNSFRSSQTLTVSEEFTNNLIELPVAGLNCNEPENASIHNEQTATGFASLMADYCPDYMNDFILHGTLNHQDIHGKVLADLEHGIKNSTLDEPVSESVCIVADTDNWSVKVYSSHRLHSERPALPALTSKLVYGILNRTANMIKLKMSPEFCMNHLENELRQLVLKSRVLAEYTRGQTRVKMGQLSAALSIESQDLPLLMSIASCHSPHVARMML